MADNSIKLLLDDNLFQNFRKNAFEQAKQFDINNVLPFYESLYSKLISNSLS
jgi:hypothetical protein